MAVYTHIDDTDMGKFLALYDLGDLESFQGIAKGVSNTNYHVSTTRGRYILTIFEEHRTKREDLPFCFAFSDHLAQRGIACPQALLDKRGEAIGALHDKPAVMIGFLDGADIGRGQTKPEHCARMGVMAARMHLAALDFRPQKDNAWAMGNWRALAASLYHKMDSYAAGLRQTVCDELDFVEKNWPDNLPAAAIHADLFPDNVFFKGDDISGVIDFYFACTDNILFDLAIVINAWCFDERHVFQQERYRSLMEGYEAVRPLSGAERKALNTVLRGTALRYLLSRLQELFAHNAETVMTPHNPQEYIEILRFHQGNDVRDV